MTSKTRGNEPPSAVERRPSTYARIKQAIADGRLAPGAPLVETALAEWCEVSRTPIREALTRLEQDGLVTRTDRGLVVRERSPEEVLDIYETRIVLEGTVARTAAARRTPIDLIHLRHAASEMAAVDTADEEAMAAANRAFHRRLWAASHNESLTDLLDRLDFHIARYPRTTLSRPGRWEQALVEHGEIVAAVEERQLQLAEDLAREHFTKARDIRLEILASEIDSSAV
ncbi:GntR family transcriptional regulator [Glaciibacter superstes]|uniref:GntR family transcriptional regulator n=1 Tax=Glaciibacter superstes TaxID=501023 RepID=UPI0003B699BE|nr:GntR family transcriptional regulator [Glaciibacter superstes]